MLHHGRLLCRAVCVEADPLVGPAEAAPVPVLCSPKELLEELEHPVGLQPLPVCLEELLEAWALHVIHQISPEALHTLHCSHCTAAIATISSLWKIGW